VGWAEANGVGKGLGERKVEVRCEVGRVDGHSWMEGDDYRSCRGEALFGRSGESGEDEGMSGTHDGTGRESQEMAGVEKESDRWNEINDQYCPPLIVLCALLAQVSVVT
jgi:hypothetical protein